MPHLSMPTGSDRDKLLGLVKILSWLYLLPLGLTVVIGLVAPLVLLIYAQYYIWFYFVGIGLIYAIALVQYLLVPLLPTRSRILGSISLLFTAGGIVLSWMFIKS